MGFETYPLSWMEKGWALTNLWTSEKVLSD